VEISRTKAEELQSELAAVESLVSELDDVLANLSDKDVKGEERGDELARFEELVADLESAVSFLVLAAVTS